MNMKHLKLFEQYTRINEDNGNLVKDASNNPIINHQGNGKFIFSIDGIQAQIQFNRANITTKYSIIKDNERKDIEPADIWHISDSDFNKQGKEQKLMMRAIQGEDGERGIYIGMPKGYTGKINYNPSSAELGKGGTGTNRLLSVKGTENVFGVFSNQQGDDSIDTSDSDIHNGVKKPITKIEIFVISDVVPIELKAAFKMDDFTLEKEAQTELIKGLKSNRSAGVKEYNLEVGATQDEDPQKLITPSNPKVGERLELKDGKTYRKNYDRKLVQMRYDYIKNGIKKYAGDDVKINIKPIKSLDDMYGMFDKNNLKNNDNRGIILIPVK